MATLFSLLFLFSFNYPAAASVKYQATLKATQACDALQSIRKETNPGNVTLTPGAVYPVVEKNKKQATHYRLEIENADPSKRWVSVDCGEIVGSSSESSSSSSSSSSSGNAQGAEQVLAISWQPAFCETHGKKTECKTQIATRFDAQNFTLHGLFPQPQYCGVSDTIEAIDQSGAWGDLPPIDLPEALFEELKTKMPGVASDLHLHEWYKHGTCYSDTPAEYFSESLALLDQVNQTGVRDLFVNNKGMVIQADQIRDQFDQAFEEGAGDKVSVKCTDDPTPRRRRMVQELKLNLKGDIEPDTSMMDLLASGKRVGRGCAKGEVDRTGIT